MSWSTSLRLLRGLPVTSIFPAVACSKRQFLRKVWAIQLAFFLSTVCKIFLTSCTLWYTSPFFILVRSVQLISIPLQASHFKTLLIFLIYFPNCIVSVNKFAMIFKLLLLCRKIFERKCIRCVYYVFCIRRPEVFPRRRNTTVCLSK